MISVEASEELVMAWLNQKGFFTLNNYRVGNKEIDLLALNPINNDKIHVEISVSVNPVGPHFGGAKIGQAPSLDQRVEKYVEKKFRGTKGRTMRRVEEIFGTKNYRKMLIIGLLNPKYDQPNRFKREFAKHNVEVINFSEVMKGLTILKTRYTDARRYIQLERTFGGTA